MPDCLRSSAQLHSTFLGADGALFALRNPDAMRARFGAAGGPYPSFALLPRHPLRALLLPAHGLIYYVPTDDGGGGAASYASPSVRGHPTRFRWKKRSGCEAFKPGPGAGAPAVVYTPYVCVVLPPGGGDAKTEGVRCFDMRVYELHAAACGCRACHRVRCPAGCCRSRAGFCGGCGWAEGPVVRDADGGGALALVQIRRIPLPTAGVAWGGDSSPTGECGPNPSTGMRWRG